MTLVLSAGTQDFLVQVSDRRLTDPHTGKIIENMAVKTVAYCNFMVVAYTGVAEVAGERTDIWIARQLQQVEHSSCSRAAGRLREATEEAFRGRRSPRRLAVVALGWYSGSEGDGLHPSVAQISNFHDGNGNRLPEARPTFQVSARYYPAPRLFVHVAGVSPRDDDMTSLTRTIRRALPRGGGQRAVMRLLAQEIRKVADREPAVGQNLLASCHPRDAATGDPTGLSYIIKGNPRENEASFHDLRGGGPGHTRHQPHIVGPQAECGVRLTDLRLERDP